MDLARLSACEIEVTGVEGEVFLGDMRIIPYVDDGCVNYFGIPHTMWANLVNIS